MKKYIIKNCPAFCDVDDDWDCISRDTEELKCQNFADCLLKQIVEKCEFWINFCKECRETDILCEDCTYSGKAYFAKEILSMLEIEECEE